MPPVLLALLAVAAVALFALDGFNIRSARFEPRGFALACAVLVVLSPVIAHLGG